MPALVYGKVTGRHYKPLNSKTVVYQINGNINLETPNGSLIDRSLAFGRYGWFAFDNGTIVDFDNSSGLCETTIDTHKKRAQHLKVACERMVSAHSQLSANDRAIVCNTLAFALSGTVSALSWFGSLASLCAGDFTGTIGGAAVGAVTGALAAMSFKNMTIAMQKAYECTEQFVKALDTYHKYAERYAPEHMRNYPVYDPEFEVCTKIINKIFPEMKTVDFMYNRPNWSVA